MSISSDPKRRDQATLRSETPDLVGVWKSRVSRSYDLWKTDFDADFMNMKLNQMPDPRKLTGLKTASHVLYDAAQITLNVEILNLQIYAGASHILGREVGPTDFERSQRIVTRWLNENPRAAAKTTRHAAFILQDAIMSLHDWDTADVFYYPWCLYIATLTCWAFHLPNPARSSCPPSDRNSNSNNNQVSHASSPLAARNEMAVLATGMTTCNTLEELSALAGKFDTNVLTKIMALQLASVRWAIVHDAMKVSVGLSSSPSRATRGDNGGIMRS
ncbi:hypothetical protein VTO42DRAFT_644 [Malbranchea cinnamomea]